ncbi:alpha/beta fold hydrolase [Lacrimispora sp.]|uniref:alpha/beta fold hydrolase n=1 Tax=Lacrimispora sp. TaxID=2719234 RepID=UPI00289C7A9F|nr:alpha/beta hydrolase [Lacrimispora sp.]
MKPIQTKVFKTPEGKERVLSIYNQILDQFPAEKRYADTIYGKTFILECGLPENPPLLLLHGSCSNSAFWAAEISALSKAYHVFAIDIIGEAGNSEENRYDPSADEYALWLKEVLDQLQICRVIIMGNSFGAWMALKFSTGFPEYVAKLILISPSGITPIRQEFISKSAEYVSRDKNNSEPFDDSIIGESDIPQKAKDFIMLIVQNFIPMTDALPVFADRLLQRLTMPVLLITGENDVTIDVHETARRLAALTPMSETHILQGCGHILTNVLDIAAPFLEKEGFR